MFEAIIHSRLSRRSVMKRAGAIAAATMNGGPWVVRSRGVAAQDTVTVTIWGNHPEWKDPMREILDAFEAATPGIKVELTEIPGPDYNAKLQTSITGGQPSDILGDLGGEGLMTRASGARVLRHNPKLRSGSATFHKLSLNRC